MTNTTSDFSIAIGSKALMLNTGIGNVGIGTEALAANTTGIDNLGIGNYVMQLTFGYINVASNNL